MRQLPLSEPAAEVFGQPNPAVLGYLRAGGDPYSTATWYLFDGDQHVLVNTNSARRRVADLRDDGRVSLTALAKDDWYTHVSIVGHVAQMWDDHDLADIDRIARHYTGDRFADRRGPRTSIRIAIDRWHAWGALAPGAND